MISTNQISFIAKDNTKSQISHHPIFKFKILKETDQEKLIKITLSPLQIMSQRIKIKIISNLLPTTLFMEYENKNSLILRQTLKSPNLPFHNLLINSKNMEILILKSLYLLILIFMTMDLKNSCKMNTTFSKVLMMIKVNVLNNKEWLPKLLSKMGMVFK